MYESTKVPSYFRAMYVYCTRTRTRTFGIGYVYVSGDKINFY